MINKNTTRNLLTIYTLIILGASFIAAHDTFTWILEVFPIIIALPILWFSYKTFKLTPILYWLIAIHYLILVVGAIYTYAEVPLGFWMQDWFGFERNNYDKIGHFAQGFVPAMIVRELLIRTSPLKNGKWLKVIVVSICLAISAIYELLEWWAAIAQGASAEAFLGTQGYEWDAQSDMLLAMIGAITALTILSKIHNKQLNKILE